MAAMRSAGVPVVGGTDYEWADGSHIVWEPSASPLRGAVAPTVLREEYGVATNQSVGFPC